MKKILPFLVLVLVFTAYLPSLTAGFVNWDDGVHLLENFTLRPWAWPNFLEIWTTTINETYIPLTTTTWALERHFFGLNPFIFHLNNVLLHLGVSAMVMMLGQRLGLSWFTAIFAGLLFGIHPMHVESVAWVTERKDVLYAFFYVWALVTYVDYAITQRKKYFWMTLGLLALSICAKPMALSFPLAALLIDWYLKRKWTPQVVAEKIFCAGVVIPGAFVTYWLNSQLVEPAVGQGPLIWMWCFLFYLYKFFIPSPLHLIYTVPWPATFVNPMYVINAMGMAVLVMVMWVWRRHRLFIFAIIFYVAHIFFLLRFKAILLSVSDRFMYVASIGLCLLIAVWVEVLYRRVESRRWLRRSVVVGVISLVGLLGVMAARQCQVWQNSVTLWQHQLRHNTTTGTWLAYYYLANAMVEANPGIGADDEQFDRAMALYQRALAINPTDAQTYYEIGNLYAKQQDLAKAQEFYHEVLRRSSGHFNAIFKLGQIAQQRGMPQEAIAFYRQAQALSPGNMLLCRDIRQAYDQSIRAQENVAIYQQERLRMPRCD